DPDLKDHLKYLHQSIADTQQQIMQLEEENEENELPQLLNDIDSVEGGRYALERLAQVALQHGYDAAKCHKTLTDTQAQLRQMEESTERAASALRAAEDHNLNVWGALPPPNLAALLAHVSSGTSTRSVSPNVWGALPPPNLAALLAHVSSGTSTRSVSPVDSSLIEQRLAPEGTRESVTAPASPSAAPNGSPFHRNTGRRGSVRLRDLGVYGREDAPDPMTQSMIETTPAPAPLSRVPSAPGSLRRTNRHHRRGLSVYCREGASEPMTQSMIETTPAPAPLSRVPSAPGSLSTTCKAQHLSHRGLMPLGTALPSNLPSPLSARRIPPKARGLYADNIASPSRPPWRRGRRPPSPAVARRNRDDDVFLRLAGATTADAAPPRGVVKEFAAKEKGMKVNVSKTKVMVFEREESRTTCELKIDGVNVEQVDEFVYLGSLFSRDGRCDNMLEIE
ncbi:unnamed protein product, partial [Plutella xylostella]